MDISNNIIINPKLKHVFGNMLRIAVPLVMRQVEVIDGVISTTDYDFHPSADYPVTMEFMRGTTLYKFKAEVRDGTIAYVEESGTLPVGLYSIAVVCRDDHGVPYRFKERAALAVVDCTADAGIEDGVEFEVETQYLDGAVFFGAAGKGIEYMDVSESQEPGGANTMTFHFTDGTVQTITVLNGTVPEGTMRRVIMMMTFDGADESFTDPDGNMLTDEQVIAIMEDDTNYVNIIYNNWTYEMTEKSVNSWNFLAPGQGYITRYFVLTEEGGGLYIQESGQTMVPEAQVNSDWNEADPDSKAYILNKPSIPAAQVNADWNAVSGVAQILNKPTIPAPQVNADWNAVGGVAEILNKPVIPAPQVQSDWDATEGMGVILNKPTIPAAQVNSDWDASSGVAEILNKPTIPSNTSDLVNDSNFTTKGMYMGVCETAAATAAKEATTDTFPTDEDGHPLIGTMIGIKFTNTDSCTTAPTINVNNTGAYGIMYGAGTVASKASSSYTGYAGNYIYYTFTEVNGTKYWMWVNRSTYQTNTDVEPGRIYGTAYKTGDYTMFRNTLCGMTAAGRIEPLVLSSSTGTSKTRNTHGFQVGRFYYNASTTTNSVAANTVITSNILWLLYTSGYVDFRYSSNAGSTLTANKPLYLVGTIGADGLFYLDTTWWTQTLPTTADGKVYVDIGMTYDTYRFIFTGGTVWYEYRDGRVRIYNGG